MSSIKPVQLSNHNNSLPKLMASTSVANTVSPFIQISGILYKQSRESPENWSKRFVIFDGLTLVYYRNKMLHVVDSVHHKLIGKIHQSQETVNESQYHQSMPSSNPIFSKSNQSFSQSNQSFSSSNQSFSPVNQSSSPYVGKSNQSVSSSVEPKFTLAGKLKRPLNEIEDVVKGDPYNRLNTFIIRFTDSTDITFGTYDKEVQSEWINTLKRSINSNWMNTMKALNTNSSHLNSKPLLDVSMGNEGWNSMFTRGSSAQNVGPKRTSLSSLYSNVFSPTREVFIDPNTNNAGFSRMEETKNRANYPDRIPPGIQTNTSSNSPTSPVALKKRGFLSIRGLKKHRISIGKKLNEKKTLSNESSPVSSSKEKGTTPLTISIPVAPESFVMGNEFQSKSREGPFISPRTQSTIADVEKLITTPAVKLPRAVSRRSRTIANGGFKSPGTDRTRMFRDGHSSPRSPDRKPMGRLDMLMGELETEMTRISIRASQMIPAAQQVLLSFALMESYGNIQKLTSPQINSEKNLLLEKPLKPNTIENEFSDRGPAEGIDSSLNAVQLSSGNEPKSQDVPNVSTQKKETENGADSPEFNHDIPQNKTNKLPISVAFPITPDQQEMNSVFNDTVNSPSLVRNAENASLQSFFSNPAETALNLENILFRQIFLSKVNSILSYARSYLKNSRWINSNSNDIKTLTADSKQILCELMELTLQIAKLDYAREKESEAASSILFLLEGQLRTLKSNLEAMIGTLE